MHPFVRNFITVIIYLSCSVGGLLQAQFNLLKDIYPGNGSSMPEHNASSLVWHDRIYFAANDGVHGIELWVTDGSENGTSLLKDINPGPSGSSPSFFYALDSLIVFMAKAQNDTMIELWRTDGTAEGTLLIKEMGPETTYSIYSKSSEASFGEVYNGVLLFHAGRELWSTDGTTEGTFLINPTPYPLEPYEMVTYKGKVFFIDQGSDWMYCTDGTEAGTVQIEMPLYAQSYGLSPIGDILYFVGHFFGIASDGREPWITDGTKEGSYYLKNINQNACEIDCHSMTYGKDHKFWKVKNQWVVFAADDEEKEGFKLWRTDGTRPGTTLLQEFGMINGFSFVKSLYGFRDAVLFFARDSVHGMEIWKTEGEPWNTSLLKDIDEGVVDGIPNDGKTITHTHQNKVYFKGRNAATGISLWETDGTPDGTKRVEGFYESGLSKPGNLVSLGSILLLSAFTEEKGFEIYTFNPSPSALSVSGEIKHPTCFNGEDGEIRVSANGGEFPYSIEWINQNMSGFHVTGLAAGIYGCIVNDDEGNSIFKTFILLDPPPLDTDKKIIPATQHMSNGVFEVMAAGGTLPYSFTWSHDNALTGSVATNLPPGTYTCTVTDAVGCEQYVIGTVKQITSLDQGQSPASISINPNPVTGGEIILRSMNDFDPGTGYSIYNSMGEVVLMGMISNRNKVRIDVSELLPGAYYFQVFGSGSHFSCQRMIRM